MHGPFSWRKYRRREDFICGCPGATPGECGNQTPGGSTTFRVIGVNVCGGEEPPSVEVQCYQGEPSDITITQRSGVCDSFVGGDIEFDCPGCPKELLLEFPLICQRDFKKCGYSGQSFAGCQTWTATSTFTIALTANSKYAQFIDVTGPYYFVPDGDSPDYIYSSFLCMDFANAGYGDAFRRVQLISGRNRDRYTGPVCAHYRLGAKGAGCFGDAIDLAGGYLPGLTALHGPVFGLTHFGEQQIAITRGTNVASGQSRFGGTFPLEDAIMDLPLFGAQRRENPLCPQCPDKKCCDQAQSYDEETGRLLGVCRMPGEEDLKCFSCRPAYRGFPAVGEEPNDNARGVSGHWGYGHFAPIDNGPTSGYFSFACFNANGWIEFVDQIGMDPEYAGAIGQGVMPLMNPGTTATFPRYDFPAMSVHALIKGTRNLVRNRETIKHLSMDTISAPGSGYSPIWGASVTAGACEEQYPCIFDINCTGNDSTNNQGDSWWNTIDPGGTDGNGASNLALVMNELRRRVNSLDGYPFSEYLAGDPLIEPPPCYQDGYHPYRMVTPNVFLWDKESFLAASTADRWKHIYTIGNPNIIYDSGCDSSYGNNESIIVYVDNTMHQEGANANHGMRVLSWMGCDGRDSCDTTSTDIRLLRCDGKELDDPESPPENGLSAEFHCESCYSSLSEAECSEIPFWKGMISSGYSSTGAAWGNCCRDFSRLPAKVDTTPARAIGAFGNEGLGGVLVVPSNGSLVLFKQQAYGEETLYGDFDGFVNGPAGDFQEGNLEVNGELVPPFLRATDSCTGVASGFCTWPIAILSGKTGGATGEIYNFGYEWTKLKGIPADSAGVGPGDKAPGRPSKVRYPPLGLTGTKVWAATHHVAVLRGDKSLTCYGMNNSGQCNIPNSLMSSPFLDAIAVGRDYFLDEVLKRSDGITSNSYTGHNSFCCPINCALQVFGYGPTRQIRCFCDADGLSATDVVGGSEVPGATFCVPIGNGNLTFNNRWIEARTMGVIEESGMSGELYGWGDNSCGTIGWPPSNWNETTDLAQICVKYDYQPSPNQDQLEQPGITGNCCLLTRRCSLVQTRSRRRGGLNRFFRSRRRYYQWRCSDDVSATAFFPEAAFVKKPDTFGKCKKVTGTRTQTCVVMFDGSVKCWGLQGINSFPTSFPRMETCTAGCSYTNYSLPELRTSCTVPAELESPDSTLDVVCVETEAEDIVTHYSGRLSGVDRYLIVPWSGCVALTATGKLKIWGNWYRPVPNSQCGGPYNSGQWCFNSKLDWINTYASEPGQDIVKIEECRGGVICLHRDGYVSILSNNARYTPYWEGGPPTPTFLPRPLPKRINYGKDNRLLCEYVYNCPYIAP